MTSLRVKTTFPLWLAALMLTLCASTVVLAQTNRQQGQQGQQGIPAEKKRSLSRIGPEDVFPEAREQDGNRSSGGSPTPRRRGSTSASRPSPSPTPTSEPAQSPIGLTGDSPLPSPTPEAALPVQRVNNDKSISNAASTAAIPPPSWLLPLLIAVALIVLTALIYVIYKLSEKLRQGSN